MNFYPWLSYQLEAGTQTTERSWARFLECRVNRVKLMDLTEISAR